MKIIYLNTAFIFYLGLILAILYKTYNMKKIIPALLIILFLGGCDVLKNLPQTTVFTEQEASVGIKEALTQGLTKSILQLNKQDGFFGDAFYKILLPPDAQKIEKTLRDIGLNKMVDKAILQINRGAEDAAGYAKPIFIDAIKNMTLSDAIGLVRNGDTSITHFFREKTTEKLISAFAPVIKSSLNKVEATRYYGDVVNTYNSFPTTFKKINPDLQNYVTSKATEALFNLIAKEELNIRTNFGARSSEILKKVFGKSFF